MLKRKIDKYLENWLNERKTTLLIKGARQIGKTFSVVEFARKNFTHFININFAERTDLIDMFAQLRNSEQLIVNLSTIDGQNMVEGETLIFFDEIQLLYQRRDDLKNAGKLDLNSQDIITAMKTISILGKYRVILSGSLLGTEVKDIVLSPLGYQDEYQMFPLDFEEFLWAKGVGEESISYVRKCFEDKQEVPDSINQMYLNYFREYVLIGGMPEAVTAYIETLNLHKVQLSQEQITSKYTYDITTYIKDEAKKLRVRDIFNSMPAELNSKNKRFVSTHVVEPSFL